MDQPDQLKAVTEGNLRGLMTRGLDNARSLETQASRLKELAVGAEPGGQGPTADIRTEAPLAEIASETNMAQGRAARLLTDLEAALS